MKILGNIIWLVFGGLMIAIEYFLAGIIFIISIIGIPFGLQCFKMGVLALWPFGTSVVSSNNGVGSGCLNLILNVIWLFIGAIPLVLSHLFWGVILCITIIGIPFGLQHFKMIPLALFPFGKTLR